MDSAGSVEASGASNTVMFVWISKHLMCERQNVVRHVVFIWQTYTALPVDAMWLSLTCLDVRRCDLITISPVHRTVLWQPYEHFHCYWKTDLFHFAFQRLTYWCQRIYTNVWSIVCVCDLKVIKKCRLLRNILQNTLNFMHATIACKKKRRRTRICLISTPNTFRLVSFLSLKHKPLISSD